MKKNIYGIELKKLEEEMLALGQKKFRATQLFTWLYEKKATSFDEMSDISLKFREVLNELYYIELPKVVVRQDAMDGTIKLLVEVDNGAKVECVLMRYEYGNAICVTSQVGCNMGCAFCASGLLKKNRNLETHEIVGQVLLMNKLLEEENEKVTHIVVMGTGEPFDNYENVLDFVRIMNHPKGLEIGARHITVSTCGIVPKIKEYALDEAELESKKKALIRKGIKAENIVVQRFKGLGEMDPAQLRETTIDPNSRRLMKLTLTTESDDNTFALLDMLFSKSRAEDRRQWLEENGDKADMLD